MMKKYCFNMIEIILAVSVIAIGLSSVMGLFSAGLKVGNDTVAGSNMSDVSESLLSYIRAEIDKCRSENGWNGGELDKIATSNEEQAHDWSDYLIESNKKDVIVGNSKGRYLYRQLSVTETDTSGNPTTYTPVFPAEAVVKRLKNTNRFNDIVLSDPADPTQKFDLTANLKDAEKASGVTLLDKFRVVLQVTVSYPVGVPAGAQTSKIFFMECFNDKYDRFAEEGVEGNGTP